MSLSSRDFIPHVTGTLLGHLVPMRMTFREALIHAADQSGLTIRHIAEEAGVSYEQLKKLKQRPDAKTNADDAVRVAHYFGVSLEAFLDGTISCDEPTVTIAGRVGAGARVPVFDAYEKGGGPQVFCPPGLSPHGVVAVEIEGNSMEPVYSAGDLLFYTRHTHEGVPSEAIGKRCVCEDTDSHGWIKIVREGRDRGLFDLYSFNDSSPPLYGVRLKWAAPVLLHWPEAMARKIMTSKYEG